MNLDVTPERLRLAHFTENKKNTEFTKDEWKVVFTKDQINSYRVEGGSPSELINYLYVILTPNTETDISKELRLDK
jgi:hypothetical protein